SRVISAVVALPCSMSGDHGPPACSVARNRGPSGLKMAVISVSAGQIVGRLLRRVRETHNNRGGYVDEACGLRACSAAGSDYLQPSNPGEAHEHPETAKARHRLRRGLP